ncbi:hypothetical protein Zmor_019890 [Zophobas morio]|uniref:Uncharacterized protein n=1 Tax=Zophobas morio TaxID=2755281 RepID=A0AA38M9H0_9CUCU|nr:hypothetical protein Zmor_019890 [Zophobas morio]
MRYFIVVCFLYYLKLTNGYRGAVVEYSPTTADSPENTILKNLNESLYSIRLGYIMTLKRHVDDVESTSYAVNFKSSYFFPLHCKSDFAETGKTFVGRT